VKVYGWDAVKLSNAYTLVELAVLREAVIAKHRLSESNGIYVYDKPGYKKLDAIAWAVTHRMQEARAVSRP
jgi:IS6 family transposase